MRNTLIRSALIRGTATAWTQQPQQQQFTSAEPEGGAGEPAPEGEPKPEPEGDPKPEPEKEPDDKIDWKAMARKHEAENKKLRPAAAELEKIKAKNRSAEESAQKERDEAKAEAEAAKAEAAIERAARKHGLTDDKDLEVLAGLPADKVEAVAKAIAAGKKTAPAAGGAPAGGGKPPAKPTTLSGAIQAHYQK